MRKNITIERNGQQVHCELKLHDGELGLNPKFNLLTISGSHHNTYIITAKICGLNQCRESRLYFQGYKSEHISEYDSIYLTNEETLTENEVLNIFGELTQD